ncbi:MAG: hypothetical protein ACI8QG_000575 [Flavobacteriales bacterium]|jgi:hypothetical protein
MKLDEQSVLQSLKTQHKLSFLLTILGLFLCRFQQVLIRTTSTRHKQAAIVSVLNTITLVKNEYIGNRFYGKQSNKTVIRYFKIDKREIQNLI